MNADVMFYQVYIGMVVAGALLLVVAIIGGIINSVHKVNNPVIATKYTNDYIERTIVRYITSEARAKVLNRMSYYEARKQNGDLRIATVRAIEKEQLIIREQIGDIKTLKQKCFLSIQESGYLTQAGRLRNGYREKADDIIIKCCNTRLRESQNEPQPDDNWISVQRFFEKRNLITDDCVGVYILYNTNKNMYYVGQATRLFFRVNQHFTGHGNGDVYADYKYGDSFLISLIKLTDSGYESLDKLEKDMIKEYDAYYSGYNKTAGNGN